MADPYFTDMPPIAKQFLNYLGTVKGRSARTVEGYHIDLRTFLRFMKLYKSGINLRSITDDAMQETDITDLDLDFMAAVKTSDIYEFMQYTLQGRNNNAATRSRKTTCIRTFYKYLTLNLDHPIKDNPAKNLEVPKIKKSLPKYLTLEQSLELLNSVETSAPERDYCMITLFLNCGMRLSELVGINLSDIQDNTLRLIGKGNKERIIYINQACMDSIQNYLKIRNQQSVIKDKNALFLTRNGTRIGARRVEKIVEEVLRKAGLANQGFSVHKLRHTAATLMYQHGDVDIRILKDVLGHANLGTTEIYTHISNQQMESAMNHSPLSKVKPKNNSKT
ncbi:MAG: tyrosine recombinase XerC [Clostridiales bacterium]|nr:tyrosine recombinase XerC [Clostridiales bacterium]